MCTALKDCFGVNQFDSESNMANTLKHLHQHINDPCLFCIECVILSLKGFHTAPGISTIMSGTAMPLLCLNT